MNIEKSNGADPTAGEGNNRTELGSQPPNVEMDQTQPLTKEELEEALAKTVEPPDGGQCLMLSNRSRYAVVFRMFN